MTLRWHVLMWSSIYYLMVNEGFSVYALALFPVVVLLPWYWLFRSNLFKRTGHLAWLSMNIFHWLRFFFIFAREFLFANWKLIKIVWTPRKAPIPCWIEVSTTCRAPFAHMMIANFISLTPGTISWKIDAYEGGATISVHLVNDKDVESVQVLVDDLESLVNALTVPKNARDMEDMD